MNIYRESIQRFVGPDWTVRIWREKDPADAHIIPKHDDDVSEVLNERGGMYFEELAIKLLQLPRMNRVEVVDKAGNGCVLYASEEVEINHRRFTII